jgi:ATP-dependent RNA helicase RhlE
VLSHSSLSFSSLGLNNSILSALERSGYETPTPIQAQAIPAALEGRDLLGCAQTGTGKTAAFALPIIHRLTAANEAARAAGNGGGRPATNGPRLARALVLSPTRELATQIGESFQTYSAGTGMSVATIYGGVSQIHQVRALARGVDIIVATPGRLMDLMDQRIVRLGSVQTFVLDEADRMLDMGFIAPIREIASTIPSERQTLLFSATMPREIVKLAESLLRNPVRVSVTPVASAAPKIEQVVHAVQRNDKPSLLIHLLKDAAVTRSMVFVRTKHGADKLCLKLQQSGIYAQAIHGNRNQNQRQRSLDAFRTGRIAVLVATDVAARGIDIDDVSHVFNFDLPHEPEAYVHRIGRTGRAGAAGIAVAFCDGEERKFLRSIEKLLGKQIAIAPRVAVPKAAQGAPAAPYIEPEVSPSRRGGAPRPHHGAHQGAHQGARQHRGAAPHHGGSNHGAPQHNGGQHRAPRPHASKPGVPPPGSLDHGGWNRGTHAPAGAPMNGEQPVRLHSASNTRTGPSSGQKTAARSGLVSRPGRGHHGHDHRPRGAGVHTANSRG